MDTAKIKSLIRHALTAIGTLLVLTGLNRFIPLVEYLTENVDATFQAIEVLVGVVVAVAGFLRNKDRFKEVEASK
jgi:chemotaxis methyl-accepting protein methylase